MAHRTLTMVKTSPIGLFGLLVGVAIIGAQERSPRNKEAAASGEIPKGYELGEADEARTSPDGKFAVLFPVRNEEYDRENGPPYPSNLLVRLRPFAVLAKVRKPGLPLGWQRELRAEWNGNAVVAIWEKSKWGIVDLSVYEIENDKVKRVHLVFREARKSFDRDFQERFRKKYPKESSGFTFVSNDKREFNERDFEFQGRKLLLKSVCG